MAACDLSSYSALVMDHAASLADALKAEMVIVNVINQTVLRLSG